MKGLEKVLVWSLSSVLPVTLLGSVATSIGAILPFSSDGDQPLLQRLGQNMVGVIAIPRGYMLLLRGGPYIEKGLRCHMPKHSTQKQPS